VKKSSQWAKPVSLQNNIQQGPYRGNKAKTNNGPIGGNRAKTNNGPIGGNRERKSKNGPNGGNKTETNNGLIELNRPKTYNGPMGEGETDQKNTTNHLEGIEQKLTIDQFEGTE
jgi:hypothetical protein